MQALTEKLLLHINTVELKQFKYQKSLGLPTSCLFMAVAEEVIRTLTLSFDTDQFVETGLKRRQTFQQVEDFLKSQLSW